MHRILLPKKSRPSRAAVAAAVLGATVAVCSAPVGGLPTAAAERSSTPISAGSLVWGFKQSFRAYTGAADGTPGALTVRGGASADRHGVVTFPVEKGSFDPSTKSTDIDFTGSMQFRAHCEGGLGLPAGQCALDMTFSDFEIALTPTKQVLRAHLVGRRNTTGYPIVDNGVITIANLDVAPARIASSNGVTSWTGIVASLAADAAAPTTYNPGTPLDPVAVSYTGPGGKPATGDQFTPAGTHTIARQSAWTGPVAQNQPVAVYVDNRNHAVHVVQSPTSFDTSAPAVRSLGLPELTSLGAGSRASASDYAGASAFDPAAGTVFLAGADGITAETWNGSRYQQDTVASAFSTQALAWDAAHDTLQALVSGDDGVTTLRSFVRHGATWTATTRTLPVPADQDPSSYFVPGSATSFAVLSDGDLLLARGYSIDAAGDIDNNPDPLLLRTSGADVAVSAVPITTHPHGDSASGPDASSVTTGPGNQAAFYGNGNTGHGPSVRLMTFSGAAVDAAAPQPLPLSSEEPLVAAFDPSDGTVWVKGVTSGTLIGLRDGKTVSTLADADAARAYTLQVADDHTIVTGGRTAGSHPSVTSYDRLGISPTITTEPVPATTPAGANVTFTANATGSPTPTVHWQQQLPGVTTFADIPGATSATMTVRATDELNGSTYRAVFRNPAGTIGTRAAPMRVLAAPVIARQPADHTATAGASATFQVMSSGSPEPTVTWQRSTAGRWVDVTAGPSVALGTGTVTISHVSSAQNGLRLRAKIANSQGTVYSRAATLTVTASAGSGSGTYRDVSLVWSGDQVLQKPSPAGPGNHFSAGVSDGSRSTYRASTGNVTVQQRVGGRIRTATYATRNAFADGGQQWVWLRHGSATVRPDGSSTVSWTGSWSVNFYGGLAPFTLTNPTLTVNRNGAGTLRADLSGYSSSQADPTHKTKLAPARHVVVSNFNGVHLNTAGKTSVQPAFRGVRITGFPTDAQPQNTRDAGWGAWPQSFVKFQFKTGLSSYWYTSGGAADADKPGAPFTVDFSANSPTPPATGGTAQGTGISSAGADPAIHPAVNPPAVADNAAADGLASTGTNVRLSLATGAALLLAGTFLAAAGRRRRRAIVEADPPARTS